MSISDRLDEIASSIDEQESEHAPWHYTEFGVLCSCGSPMTDEKCPDFDYDKAAMLSALRAVLDVHMEYPASGKCTECSVAPYSVHSVPWPCPTVRAVTAALGEDQP